MKKILIATWTFTLSFVASAADSLVSTSSITNSYSMSVASSVGDGTGTCIAERSVGDGTGTCIATRTNMDLVQLERLKLSLKIRSPEEKEMILIKLEEILNDEISN